jgi:putative phage-type endonuclease
MINPNTNKWLMWRKEGIGSADAPIIMGMSPWSTPYKLYLDKIGEAVIDEKEEASKRYIFEKGHQVESIARSQIEIENGVFYPPILYQMENFPWLRCSMDGANESLMEGKEFKLVSKKEFDDGVCPPKYIPQVQHQYMVSGYKKIVYPNPCQERSRILVACNK